MCSNLQFEKVPYECSQNDIALLYLPVIVISSIVRLQPAYTSNNLLIKEEDFDEKMTGSREPS